MKKIVRLKIIRNFYCKNIDVMIWSECFVHVQTFFEGVLLVFSYFRTFQSKMVIFNANLRRKFSLLCLNRNLNCFSKFIESYYPNFWLLVEESRKCMNVKLKQLNDLLGLEIKRIKEYSSIWTSFHIFRLKWSAWSRNKTN